MTSKRVMRCLHSYLYMYIYIAHMLYDVESRYIHIYLELHLIHYFLLVSKSARFPNFHSEVKFQCSKFLENARSSSKWLETNDLPTSSP